MPGSKPPRTELSTQEQAFVLAYVASGNASEAARKAGYKGSASVAGARLMARQHVRAAIAAAKAKTDAMVNKLIAGAAKDIDPALAAEFGAIAGIAVDHAYIAARRIEIVEKGLGHIPTKVTITTVGKNGKKVRAEVEKYILDMGAANHALNALNEELLRLEGQPGADGTPAGGGEPVFPAALVEFAERHGLPAPGGKKANGHANGSGET